MIKKQQPSNPPRVRQTGRLTTLALISGLAIAGLTIAGPDRSALAQSAGKVTGTMDATAERGIPKGAAIRVRASSGAPEVQAIADLFRDALESAGYRVNAGNGYILNFQVSGQTPDSRRRSGLELRGGKGSSGSGDVDLTMRWKTKPGKDGPPARQGRRLTVIIDDPERHPVWRAQVSLHAIQADDIALADAVMPALIANLGRTVYALRVP